MSRFKYLDDAIAVRPDFLELLEGDHRAAILLSQAVYWQLRNDGWWWKTAEDWESETWIPEDAQRRVRSKLREFDFWHEERRGMPAKLHFRVDLQQLDATIDKQVRGDDPPGASSSGGDSPDQNQQNATSRAGDSPDLEQGNARSDAPAHNADASRSETTTKTTTETSSSERDDGHARNNPNPSAPPEARRSDTDAQSDLRQQAESVGLEVGGREPIDERDGDARLGVMQIRDMAKRKLGVRWEPSNGGVWLKRLKAVSGFFSRYEIEEALDATLEGADRSEWSYFRACLNNCDEPDPTDSPSTGKAKRDKLRDRYGLGGGAS